MTPPAGKPNLPKPIGGIAKVVWEEPAETRRKARKQTGKCRRHFTMDSAITNLPCLFAFFAGHSSPSGNYASRCLLRAQLPATGGHVDPTSLTDECSGCRRRAGYAGIPLPRAPPGAAPANPPVGLSGMRFTCAARPASSAARRVACAGESFWPAMSVHSKKMRRPRFLRPRKCGRRLDQFIGERPAAARQHQRGAFRLACAVPQAHREMIRPCLLGEPQDAGHHADGADRDSRRPEIQPAPVGDDLQRRHHRVVIVQRLTHPHEHEVSQARLAVCPQRALCVEHLCHDLARAQVPHETHLPRRAKYAAHRAPGLRAHTRGEAALVAHQHGFDGLPVREPQEKFSCQPIAARDLIGKRGCIEIETSIPRTKLLRRSSGAQGREKLAHARSGPSPFSRYSARHSARGCTVASPAISRCKAGSVKSWSERRADMEAAFAAAPRARKRFHRQAIGGMMEGWQ